MKRTDVVIGLASPLLALVGVILITVVVFTGLGEIKLYRHIVGMVAAATAIAYGFQITRKIKFAKIAMVIWIFNAFLWFFLIWE